MNAIYELNNHRELFIDDFLTSQTIGEVKIKSHAPVAKECITALKGLYYGTILQDKDNYFFYYRGVVPGYDGPGNDGNPGEYTGVLISKDATNWETPNLGLYPKAAPNAIVFGSPETHNFVPFIDNNPNCPKEERFKAVAGLCTGGGMYRFYSPDGLHWNKYNLPGLFQSFPNSHKTLDSQNVCFWSDSCQKYFAYFRCYINEEQGETCGLRSIAVSSSRDFISWTKPEKLAVNKENEHLYVSLFAPYFRAPKFIIGTPTRFFDNRNGATDITMCHSRDGINILRPFPGAWILPGRSKNNWQNRSNYLNYNCYQSSDDEISYIHKDGTRFALRLDGFSSLNFNYNGGKWISCLMRYQSGSLECNVATSAGGYLKVGIINSNGNFIEGYSLEDCDIFFGDEISAEISWQQNTSLPLKPGEVFQLCFEAKECDIYSFCVQ
jgi:hypothetical protein